MSCDSPVIVSAKYSPSSPSMGHNFQSQPPVDCDDQNLLTWHGRDRQLRTKKPGSFGSSNRSHSVLSTPTARSNSNSNNNNNDVQLGQKEKRARHSQNSDHNIRGEVSKQENLQADGHDSLESSNGLVILPDSGQNDVSFSVHALSCISLDKKRIPPSFGRMVELTTRILDLLEPYIPQELKDVIAEPLLENKERTIREGEIRPLGVDQIRYIASSCCEQMWMTSRRYISYRNWNDCYRRPLIELAIFRSILEKRVACIDVSARGISGAADRSKVDLMIALKPSKGHTAVKPLNPAGCGDSKFSIFACPIVTQDVPGKDPVRQLGEWFQVHFAWLEQNNRAKVDALWPMPFFYVVDDVWTFGFAVRNNGEVALYQERIGSSTWPRGVCKILTILEVIIESANEHYRRWFQETFAHLFDD